jgi:hypothetical protein
MYLQTTKFDPAPRNLYVCVALCVLTLKNNFTQYPICDLRNVLSRGG